MAIYITPISVSLVEGIYTVKAADRVTIAGPVGIEIYDFKNWENGDINPVRTVNLTSDMNINATYVKFAAPLVVGVSPPSASLKVGESQLFTATPSGGVPPYTVRWIDYVSKEVLGQGSVYTFNATNAGNYQIYAEATDSVGTVAASSIIPITVTLPLPGYSITLQSDKATVWVGEKLVLTAKLFGDGTPLDGQIVTLFTDSAPLGNMAGVGNGTYNLELTGESPGSINFHAEALGVSSNVVTVTVEAMAPPPPNLFDRLRQAWADLPTAGKVTVVGVAVTGVAVGVNMYQIAKKPK